MSADHGSGAGVLALLRRIEVLREIFLGHLPPRVLRTLNHIRELQLEGSALIGRLEALRHRYHLNPPEDEDNDSGDQEPHIVRIVCSDGLL